MVQDRHNYGTSTKKIINKHHVLDELLDRKHDWDWATALLVLDSLTWKIGQLSEEIMTLEHKIKFFDYDGQTGKYWLSVKKEDKRYLKSNKSRVSAWYYNIQPVCDWMDAYQKSQYEGQHDKK